MQCHQQTISEQFETSFVLYGPICATEYLKNEPHNSEFFSIAGTLLLVKAENFPNTAKMHKTVETELSH